MNTWEERRRQQRRSEAITIGALTAVATLIVGVAVAVGLADDDEEIVTADCVDTTSIATDGSYRAVDERFCDGGSHVGYTYVYGGSYSGGRVRGATTVRPSNVGISSRSGKVIVRGGFGFNGKGGGG
ncbi:hypothetical protein [Nonomuraea sp. NPDC050643]|uniref:hypothetical protein n=1 Tax=Nonomuraea sp. NPDC050643 TaxID=3155660 RepID=UPI0033EAB15D